MYVVWKFPLELVKVQTISIPKDAQILTIQLQNSVPTIWALVSPDIEYETLRKVNMLGTGRTLTNYPGQYIGTVQLSDEHNTEIYHFFIEKE